MVMLITGLHGIRSATKMNIGTWESAAEPVRQEPASSTHCTVNHARGVCQNCTPGEHFTAAPSGMESCLPCLICKDDKVLVQECTPTANAKCECKPGYYCRPDEPCEICNRCSRCGEGQRIKKPCTSTTDIVCEDISPPESTSTKANVIVPMQTSSFNDTTGHRTMSTDPPDDPSGYKSVAFIAVPVVATILAIIILLLIVRHKRKVKDKPKDNIENSLIGGTKNNSTNTSSDSIHTEGKNCREEELPECQRLMITEHRNVEIAMNVRAAPYVNGAETEPGESSVVESLGSDVECEGSSKLGDRV
ncbi:tumor necrosis factor receptor superfamily member 14-like [Bufo gargarizans]|uniref:tumor necrosis factor receptor superfamily member 14-like n=1 Tax=Bufo gargarizans TaxID=30331 RepID=UPI001CF5BFBF|nr:tumor necrosis factor receptor superfamily member 14-like [Bufo gargarizans]